MTDVDPRDYRPLEPSEPDIEDGGDIESPVTSWRGAIGEMLAALLAVVALVAAFIGAALVLSRLLLR